MDQGLTSFDLGAFYSDCAINGVANAIRSHRKDWGGGLPYTDDWRAATGSKARTSEELKEEAWEYIEELDDDLDDCPDLEARLDRLLDEGEE